MALTLDQEILMYFEHNKQSEQDWSAMMELKAEIDNCLRRNLRQDIRLFVYGSVIPKLGTVDADLDLTLLVDDLPLINFQDKRQFLFQMKNVLSKDYEKQSKSIDVIEQPTMPIIRLKSFTFKSISCGIDISLNNMHGIRSSHLLSHYSLIDKRFRELVILIKQWASKAGIYDSQTGTFNGFGLTLLVLHFLQAGVNPPVLPNLQSRMPTMFNERIPIESLQYVSEFKEYSKNDNDQTSGEILMEFFDYYSNKVDFKNEKLSISSGCKKPRHDNRSRRTKEWLIYIEDLYDPSKNVTRRIYEPACYQKIKTAFTTASDMLKENPQLSSIGLNIN